MRGKGGRGLGKISILLGQLLNPRYHRYSDLTWVIDLKCVNREVPISNCFISEGSAKAIRVGFPVSFVVALLDTPITKSLSLKTIPVWHHVSSLTTFISFLAEPRQQSTFRRPKYWLWHSEGSLGLDHLLCLMVNQFSIEGYRSTSLWSQSQTVVVLSDDLGGDWQADELRF